MHLAGGDVRYFQTELTRYLLQGLEVALAVVREQCGMEYGGEVLENPCRMEDDVVIVGRGTGVAAVDVMLLECPEPRVGTVV